MEEKKCKVCGRTLPIGNFRITPFAEDGHAPICKQCALQKRRSKDATKPLENLDNGDPKFAGITSRELLDELRCRGYSGVLKISREIRV